MDLIWIFLFPLLYLIDNTMISNHMNTPAPHILLRLYPRSGRALLLLTVVTVIVSQIPLGGWNLVVALAIATIQAIGCLVLHASAYYDHKLYFIIFTIGVLSTCLCSLS